MQQLSDSPDLLMLAVFLFLRINIISKVRSEDMMFIRIHKTVLLHIILGNDF